MYHIQSKEDQIRAIEILEGTFGSIPGVSWMIRSSKNKHLKPLLTYCLKEAMLNDAAYISTDKNGVVFIYQIQNKKIEPNFWQQLKLTYHSMGILKAIKVIKSRKLMEKIRPKTGWHIWIMGTDQNNSGTASAYEIKHAITEFSKTSGEPMYAETTVKRALILYKLLGFYVYETINHPYQNCNMWFLRKDPE